MFNSTVKNKNKIRKYELVIEQVLMSPDEMYTVDYSDKLEFGVKPK